MNPFHRFFSLTHRQKRGTLILVFLLLLVIWVPQGYRAWMSRPPAHLSVSVYFPAADTTPVVSEEPTYFPFDPNTVDSGNLALLGLSQRQIDQWLRYREAGGKFAEKDDILRLYAMTKEQYLDLEPYIHLSKSDNSRSRSGLMPSTRKAIATVDINAADSAAWEALPGIGPVYANRIIRYRSRVGGFDSIRQLEQVYGVDSGLVATLQNHLVVGPKPVVPALPPSPVVVVELNSADSAQLVQLKGIGPVFARRIIAYRHQLGGFYHLSQLHEVYGLAEKDLTQWQGQLWIDTIAIDPLSLNTASQEALSAHPYISRSLARFIISYRMNEPGGFGKKEDLLASFLVDEGKLTQLRPYITVDR